MKITWKAPETNTDGTPFTKDQFFGWELDVDGGPAVSVPAAWDDDGTYEFDFGAGINANYAPGQHAIRLRTVGKDSQGNPNPSDWSNPAAWFIAERVPNPPFIVAVAS